LVGFGGKGKEEVRSKKGGLKAVKERLKVVKKLKAPP
jgi:hypothetical protein